MKSDRQTESWRRRRAKLARNSGVKTLSRPLLNGKALPLAYVRSGPQTSTPVLIFPGGPGLASVLPYRGLRANGAKHGLGIVMIEHRGVGMSRATTDGIDMPREEVTIRNVIDDATAVLDAEAIDRVIVYGTSYGSYLAQTFATAYPDRVAGMVLDSAMIDASNQPAAERLNELFWHGTSATAGSAHRLRALTEHGDIRAEHAGFPLQVLYEFGGLSAVDSMLTLLERDKGRRVWKWIKRLGATEMMKPRPFLMEFDLVGQIAFAELNYGAPHDPSIGPLFSEDSLSKVAEEFSPFVEEAYDLRASLPGFTWPLHVLSGERDIRTPRPTAAEIVDRAPQARLVPIPKQGHSALDTAPNIALKAIRNFHDNLDDARTQAPIDDLDTFTGKRQLMGTLLTVRLRLAHLLPGRLS